MHLLPPNSTPSERALSLATARNLAVPVPVKTLWSPHDCPLAVLPWLAWALSVEPWCSDWSEAQKRAAVAASIETHKIKGTVGALYRALRALGYEVAVDENTGEAYVFKLLVNAEIDAGGNIRDVGLGEPDYNAAEAAALVAKNARSHLKGVAALLKRATVVAVRAVQIDGDNATVEADVVREIKPAAVIVILAAAWDCEQTVLGLPTPAQNRFAFTGTAVGTSAHFQTK